MFYIWGNHLTIMGGVMDKKKKNRGNKKISKGRKKIGKKPISRKRPKYMMQEGPGFKLKEKPSAMKEKEMIEQLMKSNIRGITPSAAKSLYDLCNANNVQLIVTEMGGISMRYKAEKQFDNVIKKMESLGFVITGKMGGQGYTDLMVRYEEPKLITEKPYIIQRQAEETPVQQAEEKPKQKTLKLKISAQPADYNYLKSRSENGLLPKYLDKDTIKDLSSEDFRLMGISKEIEEKIKSDVASGNVRYDLEIESLGIRGAFAKTKIKIEGV